MLAAGENPFLEARWPNNTKAVDFSRYNMQRAESGALDTGGSTDLAGFFTGTYFDSDLSIFADDAWIGGYVHVTAEQGWWTKSGDIIDSSDSHIEFNFGVFDSSRETPSEADPYALMGRLAALDSENEFFFDEEGYDGPANTLYLRLPRGENPSGKEIQIKVREHGANLDNREHVILEHLTFFGSRIESNAGSAYITVTNCTVLYGAYDSYIADGGARGAIHSKGIGNRIVDSTVRHSMGTGIMVRDSDIHVINCVVENTWGHGINTDSATNIIVSDNTVYDGGSTLISISASASQINRNHVYRGGLHITDIELMNTYNSGDQLGTEIGWNWVHDNRAENDRSRRWNGGGGIRLDSGGAA